LPYFVEIIKVILDWGDELNCGKVRVSLERRVFLRVMSFYWLKRNHWQHERNIALTFRWRDNTLRKRNLIARDCGVKVLLALAKWVDLLKHILVWSYNLSIVEPRSIFENLLYNHAWKNNHIHFR